MKTQKMEDEHMRQIMKEENDELLNTSKWFPKHMFDLKKKVPARRRL
jgi:hypothetical protein